MGRAGGWRTIVGCLGAAAHKRNLGRKTPAKRNKVYQIIKICQVANKSFGCWRIWGGKSAANGAVTWNF